MRRRPSLRPTAVARPCDLCTERWPVPGRVRKAMIYQQLINGLMLGASYSLIAIGYTLIFGVLKLLYFAHGEVFMVGAFVGLYLVIFGGANIYVALLGAMITCGALGIIAVLRLGSAGSQGPPAGAADQHHRAHDRPAEPRGLYFRRPAGGVSGDHQAGALPPRAGHHQLGADFHSGDRGHVDGAALAVHRAHQDGPRHPRDRRKS